MQEWVRTTFDNYVDGLEDGQSTSDATILRVGKGTTVHGLLAISSEMSPTRFPDTLIPREGIDLYFANVHPDSHFSHPSRPTKINGRYHTDSLR